MSMEITRLLTDVKSVISKREAARQLYAAQLAPEFSIFEFVGGNENAISFFIANLLNPKGTHGQGVLFLRKFLDMLYQHGASKILMNLDDFDIQKIKIDTEVPYWVNSGDRRMDVCLMLDELFYIGIENKPWAGDGRNQIPDFLAHVNSQGRFSCKVGIYLSERAPQGESAYGLLHITYSAMASWLKSCAAECESHKVRFFCEQLTEFIEKQVLGKKDMSEINEIQNIVQQDGKTLELAMKIGVAVERAKNHLIERFLYEISEKCASEGFSFVLTNLLKPVEQDFSKFAQGSWGRPGFSLTSENRKWNLHFEFGGGCWKSLFYGIINDKNNTSKTDKDVFRRLAEKEGWKWVSNPDGAWLCYKLRNILGCAGSYKEGFFNVPESWRLLDEGLADKLVEEAQRIFNELEELHASRHWAD